MIRFIATFITIVSFLILSIPLLLAEWLIGKFNMDLKNRSSLAIVNWAFRRCLDISGVKLTVIGEENVPKDRPVLYVGNHRSFFDIPLTYVRVPRPTGYIAKKEMLKFPLLRDWMRNLHCLFLDRNDLKAGMQMILDSIEKVKSGISICIFPEGTRNKENDTFLPFHAGSFKIAEKTGCPVVPMAINNSSGILEDHFPRIKKTHVVLEYGKPIYLDDMDRAQRKNVAKMAEDAVKEMYLKNRELV